MIISFKVSIQCKHCLGNTNNKHIYIYIYIYWTMIWQNQKRLTGKLWELQKHFCIIPGTWIWPFINGN